MRLEISTSQSSPDLQDRATLMSIIEGLGKLEENDPSEPIDDHKITVQYAPVQIVIEDKGSPTGRLLNDIAGITLRGTAEWMTKNDWFREMSVAIYYNHYYCGVADFSLNSTAQMGSSFANTATS